MKRKDWLKKIPRPKMAFKVGNNYQCRESWYRGNIKPVGSWDSGRTIANPGDTVLIKREYKASREYSVESKNSLTPFIVTESELFKYLILS